MLFVHSSCAHLAFQVPSVVADVARDQRRGYAARAIIVVGADIHADTRGAVDRRDASDGAASGACRRPHRSVAALYADTTGATGRVVLGGGALLSEIAI